MSLVGTLLSLTGEMPKGEYCQKLTFSGRLATITEEPKQGRLLPVRFKPMMMGQPPFVHVASSVRKDRRLRWPSRSEVATLKAVNRSCKRGRSSPNTIASDRYVDNNIGAGGELRCTPATFACKA